MKSYVIRAGSRFTVIQEFPDRSLVAPAVADRDISFEAKELKEVDAIRGILHFVIGNTHYYANNTSVSVYH